MMEELKKSYIEFNPSTKESEEIISYIKQFQDNDGFFKLFDAFPPDKDAINDYCYKPTYYCTAILVKAINYDSKHIIGFEKQMYLALEACIKRELKDNSFMKKDDVIDNLMIFINANVSKFIANYSYLSHNFSNMIQSYIYSYLDNDDVNKELLQSFGKAFYVFVYGTLLNGQYNHSYLDNALYVGIGKINNYKLYDLGSYPGIKPEPNYNVLGELYLVNYDEIVKLDYLEGNGSLYIRKTINCEINNNNYLSYTYVYNLSIKGILQIPLSCQPYSYDWKDKLIWYVSYGSNMCFERFMCYITGEGSEKYGIEPDQKKRCNDITPPLRSQKITIPYERYFGGESVTWNNCGVAFLDFNSNKESIGRSYLITKEQYLHVKKSEGKDYQYEVELKGINGIKAFTFTNENRMPENEPSLEYKKVIEDGLKETLLLKSE